MAEYVVTIARYNANGTLRDFVDRVYAARDDEHARESAEAGCCERTEEVVSVAERADA